MHLNIEIKARTRQIDRLRQILLAEGARLHGLDRQVDTYFRVPQGRLKLRQGPIENSLIHYERADQTGPKASAVRLYHPADGDRLRELLVQALGVWKVVEKQREIYFIDNVKFHLDEVAGLGTFVEIEAIDADGSLGMDHIRRQCAHYMQQLGIATADLIEGSYSDMT
ncbi:MAG: class IV adenylate cyclase [Bacteroidia bacterium]